jgi:putative FmdB family regulatory protein
MPVYEYYCKPCGSQFELLRPMTKMDEPAVCASGHTTSNRVVSLFATMTKAEEGFVPTPPGAGGCCAGGACACGAR